MSLIEVKPKDGLTVRHPESGNPIKAGSKVLRTPAIIRMINNGDLIVIEAKAKPAPKKEAK